MSKNRLSRREMLRCTAAAAGFSIVPRFVLGGPGYTPPSEQLTKGVIGTGGMGRGHLSMGDSRLLAVCDVDAKHMQLALDMAANSGNRDVKPYRDWRELIDRKDIDIVHIATPPHWHALMVIAAANAGKDIWSEKPLSRTIGEGRKLVEAVQRNDRIFRINTRFRYEADIPDVGMKARDLKKLIDSGMLGWPVRINIASQNGFPWKLDMWSGRTDLTPEKVPPELDYDMWLGPAPYKPYHPHRVHMSFRGYWDYDGGGLGDQGQHFLDPAQYLLGKDNTSPVFIEAEGQQQHPDAARPWQRVYMRYADGCEIVLIDVGEPDPPFLEGPKGKVFMNYRSTIPDLQKKIAELPDPEPVNPDFLWHVRNRQKFVLHEGVVHRSCTLVNLGKIAIRLLRPLHYDPQKQEFIKDEMANEMLLEPMRAPWVV